MALHLRWRETLPLRMPEWIAAAMMGDWGRKAIMEPAAFQSPAFASMRETMDPVWWGILGASLGLLGLVALAINGFWQATPFLRGLSSIGRMIVWLLIEFGLINSGQPTFGTSIYIGLAGLEIWNLYRAGGDARRALKGGVA